MDTLSDSRLTEQNNAQHQSMNFFLHKRHCPKSRGIDFTVTVQFSPIFRLVHFSYFIQLTLPSRHPHYRTVNVTETRQSQRLNAEVATAHAQRDLMGTCRVCKAGGKLKMSCSLMISLPSPPPVTPCPRSFPTPPQRGWEALRGGKRSGVCTNPRLPPALYA